MIEISNVVDVQYYVEDIDAVIFDLDDTLYSEIEYVKSGFKAIAKGFPKISKMEKKLWDSFCNGEMAINQVLINEDVFSEINLNKALELYRNHEPQIQLYNGVYEMLLKLKKANKKLGIITDGRPIGQRAKIKSLGIDNLFDNIIVTDELGGVEYRKPNIYSFCLMIEKLGVKFDRSIYIGDNLKKDFKAPNSLGMKTVYFKNSNGIYK